MQNTQRARNFTSLASLVVCALTLTMVGCGGDDDVDPAANDLGEVSAPAGTEDSDTTVADEADGTTDGSTESSTSAAEDGTDERSEQSDVPSDVDLDVPPEPDATANAADHPGFEWAFEDGYQMALGYGRADFYDPSAVAEPGSMAGLSAAEAYRAGFALGLAEYEAGVAADEARVATVLDETIVGKVIRQGVGEDWVADTAGVDEECGAMVEATNPGVPCIARWINADRGDVIAVRLGNSGKQIDIAMLVEFIDGEREIRDWWSRVDGDPVPDWALPWDGLPGYLQDQ